MELLKQNFRRKLVLEQVRSLTNSEYKSRDPQLSSDPQLSRAPQRLRDSLSKSFIDIALMTSCVLLKILIISFYCLSVYTF